MTYMLIYMVDIIKHHKLVALTMSHYVTQTGLELTMQLTVASDLQ